LVSIKKEEKCIEDKLTALEYMNIARELLRPVGRSFIPCQVIRGKFHVNVNKNFSIDT